MTLEELLKKENIKSICISPFEYKLNFEEQPKISDEVYCSGFIDTDNLSISIKKSLHKEKAAVILLHEIIHGILMQSGLNLSEDEDSYYEQIIEVLSHSLYGVLIDNEDLVKLLTTLDGDR